MIIADHIKNMADFIAVDPATTFDRTVDQLLDKCVKCKMLTWEGQLTHCTGFHKLTGMSSKLTSFKNIFYARYLKCI